MRALGFVLLGLLTACRAAARQPEAASVTDHHVHLLGPQLLADWKSLGVPFSRPDAFYLEPDSLFEPRDGMPAIDAALLVPMAHYYGNEEFRSALGLSLEEELSRVQAENDHVAREAARSGPRTRLFVSVDLLRPYAQAEIERMHAAHDVLGVKVHLASAGFRFDEPQHVAVLAALARWVAAHDLVLLLHLDPQRRGLVTDDVTQLLDMAFGPLPSLRLVIAHTGGSGGFGPWPRSVLETLTLWLEREAAAGRSRPEVFVDLSAVPLIRESEGMSPSSEAEIAALAPALRRLGLARVLFASDYPVFDPRDQLAFLRARCGFTPAELEAILANSLLAR